MGLKADRSVCWKYVNPAPYTGSPYHFFLDAAAVYYNKRTLFDGTEPVVIALHGHGGSALNFGIPNYYFGHQISQLARAGFIVVSLDAGGAAGFPSPIVEAIVLAAITWAQTPRTDAEFATGVGAKPGKVGVYGYSMGGGVAVSLAKNHPGIVAAACVIAPAINLDVIISDPTYGPEIDVLYTTGRCNKTGGTQTVTGAAIDLLVDDTSTMPASGYVWRVSPTDFKSFHYNAKDATHLLGCTVGSGSVTVSNNNIVTPFGAYTGHEGFNAQYDADHGQYAAGVFTVPVKLTHGDQDTTVLPAWVAAFLASAANPVIEEHNVVGAGHVDVFQYLASDADVAWLANYLN